ncbi:MAG: hypothetical protein V5A27_03915 [Halapricum sp.]
MKLIVGTEQPWLPSPFGQPDTPMNGRYGTQQQAMPPESSTRSTRTGDPA